MPSRVAIIEDSLAGRLLLSSLFAAAHYDVAFVGSSDAFASTPDVVAELVLIGAGVARSITLVEQLRARKDLRLSPCLVLAENPSSDVRQDLISRGVRDVLDDPVPEAFLLARARSVLREAETYRELERRRQATLRFGFAEAPSAFATLRRVCWVQDRHSTEPIPALGIGQSWTLSKADVSGVLAPDASGKMPAAYVLDWRQTSKQSTLRQALPELRAREHSRHAGLLVIYDSDDPDAAIQALDSGASEVVPANAHGIEIGLRISRLLKQKTAEDALRKSAEDSLQLAVTDPLTGLYNRRYAEAYLSDLVAGREADRPFAVMIADIDRFKSINDTFGHAIGDEVLRVVAKRLRLEMRAHDLVARFGGEEFLIVLAESNLKEARRAANRLRKRIGNSPVELSGGGTVDVTVSIGVSLGAAEMVPEQMAPHRGIMANLLSRADTALYTAKASGRNRVQLNVSACGPS